MAEEDLKQPGEIELIKGGDELLRGRRGNGKKDKKKKKEEQDLKRDFIEHTVPSSSSFSSLSSSSHLRFLHHVVGKLKEFLHLHLFSSRFMETTFYCRNSNLYFARAIS